MNKILETQNVYYKNITNGVSIHVKQGEVVGLLGANGSGKTTFFQILSGLLRPMQGSIKIDNTDITNLMFHQRVKLGIGLLPQESSIFRGLTVEQNIVAALEVTSKNRIEQQLNKLLEQFGLNKIKERYSNLCSGGEKKEEWK